jgi:hypothetical protein
MGAFLATALVNAAVPLVRALERRVLYAEGAQG